MTSQVSNTAFPCFVSGYGATYAMKLDEEDSGDEADTESLADFDHLRETDFEGPERDQPLDPGGEIASFVETTSEDSELETESGGSDFSDSFFLYGLGAPGILALLGELSSLQDNSESDTVLGLEGSCDS